MYGHRKNRTKGLLWDEMGFLLLYRQEREWKEIGIPNTSMTFYLEMRPSRKAGNEPSKLHRLAWRSFLICASTATKR